MLESKNTLNWQLHFDLIHVKENSFFVFFIRFQQVVIDIKEFRNAISKSLPSFTAICNKIM